VISQPFILFPGRHHVLTRFQAEYLAQLADGRATVVWAVTSANHDNTRRNPVPFHRREAAIERFSLLAGVRSVVVPVFDTAPTERFAEVTLKNIAVAADLELTPDTTVVACSTEVARLYRDLGFEIAGVEADPACLLPDGGQPERPWDVLLRLAAGDERWRELAHPATVDVFDRYRLAEVVRGVVNDPVVGDEGGLTPTRNYRTYVDAFADGAARKWELVRRHVRPGRIVDIGCGAGAVLELADRDPALRESDLIGVEIARHLYEECVHKKAQGVFANPNVFFYRRNVLGGAVLPARSVDTTLTFALTHEIWSYGSQWDSLRRFVQAIYDHTVPGGVWLNSDVCGPDGRDKPVVLALTRDDGANPDAPRRDLGELPAAEVAGYVAGLSSRARLDQFAVDYRFPLEYQPVDQESVTIPLGAAMDYLTRKDYADNWLSEAHEQFCGLEFADWKALLADVGFEVDPASGAYRNDWLVEHRLAPVATLREQSGQPLEWPVTHVLLVARRPLNT
jgi:SAM-dependent methyltransferase